MAEIIHKSWADLDEAEGDTESDSEESLKYSKTPEQSHHDELRKTFYRSSDDNTEVKVLRPSQNQLLQEHQQRRDHFSIEHSSNAPVSKHFTNAITSKPFTRAQLPFIKNRSVPVPTIKSNKTPVMTQKNHNLVPTPILTPAPSVHFNNINEPKNMLKNNQCISSNNEDEPEINKAKNLKHSLKSNYQAALNRQRESVRDSDKNNTKKKQWMGSANTNLSMENSKKENVDSTPQMVASSTKEPGAAPQIQLKLNTTNLAPDTITVNTTFTTPVLTTTTITPVVTTTAVTKPTITTPVITTSTITTPITAPVVSTDNKAASAISMPPPVNLNSQNLPLHEIQDPRILQYIHQLEAYVRYQTQQTAQLAAQFNNQLPQPGFTAFPYPLPYVPPIPVDNLNWLGANTTGLSQPTMVQRVVSTNTPTNVGKSSSASIFSNNASQSLHPLYPSNKTRVNESALVQGETTNSGQRISGINQPQLVMFAPLLPQTSALVVSNADNMSGNDKDDETLNTMTPIGSLGNTSQNRVSTPGSNVLGNNKLKRGSRARLHRHLSEGGDIIPVEQRNYSYPIPDRPPYCVWLGNMPSTASDKDVSEYLGKMGVVMKDIRWGRRQGAHTCCYVDFYGVEDMKIVLGTVDSANAPRFMCRLLQIDINEGIRVDRESAVTAVTTQPVKTKTRRLAQSASNNEIYVTTSRNPSKFNHSSNNLVSFEDMSSVSNFAVNFNGSQSTSCLLTHVTPRRKE